MMLSRTSRRAAAVVAVCGAAFASAARSDVIELKTGQKLEGDVLKDSAGELVVDLGVDIVRIPTSQIKSRQGGAETARHEVDAKSDKHEIYSTAELPIRSLRRCRRTGSPGRARPSSDPHTRKSPKRLRGMAIPAAREASRPRSRCRSSRSR